MPSRMRWSLALFMWMLVIFVFSSQEASTSDMQSNIIVALIQPVLTCLNEQTVVFIARKSAHVFLYFVLGIFAFRTLLAYKFTRSCAILMGIGFACFYALSDELHQRFVAGRTGQLRDVIIDTVAASIGIVIIAHVLPWVKRRAHTQKEGS